MLLTQGFAVTSNRFKCRNPGWIDKGDGLFFPSPQKSLHQSMDREDTPLRGFSNVHHRAHPTMDHHPKIKFAQQPFIVGINLSPNGHSRSEDAVVVTGTDPDALDSLRDQIVCGTFIIE